MSEHIKTGEEIYLEICNICCDVNNIRDDKWILFSWLKEQVQKKYDESYNLPGDISDIRDLGRMDSLRWVLSLLEEKKT